MQMMSSRFLSRLLLTAAITVVAPLLSWDQVTPAAASTAEVASDLGGEPLHLAVNVEEESQESYSDPVGLVPLVLSAPTPLCGRSSALAALSSTPHAGTVGLPSLRAPPARS